LDVGYFEPPQNKIRPNSLIIAPQYFIVEPWHSYAVTARDIELSFLAAKGKLDAPFRVIPEQ
jgi:hypothetical protein